MGRSRFRTRSPHHLVRWFGLVVLLSVASAAAGQDGPPASAPKRIVRGSTTHSAPPPARGGGAPRAQLDLRLDTTRTEYLVDECFYATISLSNAGRDEAPFTRLLDPAVGLVTFEITRPDGQVHTYQPRMNVQLGPDGPARSILWLGPGGRYTSAIDLSYEMKPAQGEAVGAHESDGVTRPGEPRPEMLLSTPGEYSIRACYAIPADWPLDPVTIWSNELRVSVVAPTGVDLAAYQVMRASLHGREPWNAAAEQAAIYQRVLRHYPTSAYALYARWALASVRSFAGDETSRGTPAARGLLEDAATLFLSTAQAAGKTPFGLGATEAAAKTLAKLGRSSEAQALLEDAFLWPSTTDSDRTRLLAWMHHLETGYFWSAGGLIGKRQAVRCAVPLRAFALALGFSVGWEPERDTVTVSSPRLKALLRPGDHAMTVNGQRPVGIHTSLQHGRLLVSPSVIAMLIAAHWGQ